MESKLFVPITRTDEEQRMVYGYATTEAKDSYGTIIDLESIKKCLPDYMRFANIREMHQPSAVGRADDITLDKKGLYIGAKIVDDQAWKKVKEGVYKGFSIGGKQDARVDDRIFMARINEISLADRPSNEDCVFDTFRIYEEKEGSNLETKENQPDKQPEETDIKRYLGEEVYDAQTALSALDNITYLLSKEKSEVEQMPDQVEALTIVVQKLKEFIASEIKEDNSAGMFRLADYKAGDDLTLEDGTICRLLGPETEQEAVERIGASINKKNLERIQAMHDHTTAMGARCAGIEKAVGEDSDIFRIEGFNDAEGKQVEIKGHADLLAVTETFFKRIVELESQPEPAKGVQRTFTVSKENDLGGGEVERNKEKVENPKEQIKRIHAAGGQRVTF